MTFKIGKNLELVKTRTFKTAFWLSLILNVSLCGYIGYLTYLGPKIKTVVKKVPYDRAQPSDIIISDSAILKELINEGSVLPSVALAQAKIESGHFKSPVFKQNKNMFGIKYHKCQYVTGQNLNHATYASYKDNIKCYIDIQKHYLGKIDGHYAESPGYTKSIKKVK